MSSWRACINYKKSRPLDYAKRNLMERTTKDRVSKQKEKINLPNINKTEALKDSSHLCLRGVSPKTSIIRIAIKHIYVNSKTPLEITGFFVVRKDCVI